jgi:ricin-type beta-trefoil lectin protein/glycosyl hydrolase group 75 (putative chitosanase)
VRISRKVLSLIAVGSLAVATPLVLNHGASASTATPQASGDFTAAQVLAGIKKNSTSSKQVNSKPHINTMTRAMNVNVYQVAPGVYSYTSSLAVDDDGSDPDPDPDHQGQTTFQTSDGKQLGAHHVPFFVLGDDCWDRKSPCPHFFYKEHGIHGRQFALMFYQGKVIGAIFGDTQTANNQTTSDNDSRELGEASVKAAALLGINSSGISGGVDNGVTVTIFSGSSWVVNGTNSTLNNNAQAMVQKALNTLGTAMGLGGGGTPGPSPSPSSGGGNGGGGNRFIGVGSNKCMDDPNSSTTNGTQLEIWTCNGGANQQFTATGGTLRTEGKCLDAPGGATANGTIVELWTCNGGANQQFSYQSDGTIRGSQSGKCVTVQNAATTNGSKLILWTCNSGGNEHWTRT